MKAPVGLLSDGTICVSRWRGFAPTSSMQVSVEDKIQTKIESEAHSMEKSLERIDTINAEITALKSLLTDTDYKALKHADGVMSAEEYEPIRQQREEWRDKINALETELATATQEFDAEMTKMAAARVKEG